MAGGNASEAVDRSGANHFALSVPLDGLISAPEGPTLEHAMRALAVPGVSIAAIVNGQIAWSDGWGVVSTDGSQRVDGATMFQAGSISKMVAAVLSLRLVDAGLFGLDDLVAEVAGEPLLAAADGSWHPQVSVRQLLAHAGGVNNGGFPGYPTDDYPRPREVIAGSDRTNTPPIRVIGLPGTAFSYSGGGYVVLQETIQTRLGRPFEDVADEYLFEPLGLSRSSYRQTPPDANHAHGHRDSGQPIPGKHRRYPEMAAAGLWTTAADLAAVLVGLADSYAGKAQAMLTGSTIINMLRKQQPSDPYGLGVQLDRRADSLWFGHSGDTQGFLNEAIGSTVGHGLVVMTNADGAGGAKNLINAVKARAAALYGWRDEPFSLDQRDSDPDPVVVPSGRFLTKDGLQITIRPNAVDELYLSLPGQPEAVRLKYRGRSQWLADGLNVLLTCDRPDRLTIAQTLQHGPVRPLIATRAE